MVNTPTADRREIIARRPLLADSVGEMIAVHDQDGPIIDVHVAPEDSGQHAHVSLTPSEARELGDQLREIGDVAQRAGWTSAVLADVRDHYLPGASDQEIVSRLDRLTERLGHSVLGFRGEKLDWRAGQVLIGDVNAEAIERTCTAIDDVAAALTAVRDAIDRLSEVRGRLADLQVRNQQASESTA